MLVSVFLSGLVLGGAYIYKKDITVPILAHFFLNLFICLQIYLASIGMVI